MKITRIIILSLTFILIPLSLFANANSSIKNMLYKGNNLYQKKDFDNAISVYQNIINRGYEGSSVYYNLGNCFYRENKIGYAIFYYEKALRLSPGDDDIIHNLTIANSKTIDKIDVVPQFFLVQWWDDLLNLFSVAGWKTFTFLFYILFLITVGVFYFVKKTKSQKYIFYSAALSLAILVISAALLIIKYNKEYTNKFGIIVDPIVSVKISPDPNSNDAFIIHEGLKVNVRDKVDNWYKIQLHDGKVGWVSQSEVGVI